MAPNLDIIFSIPLTRYALAAASVAACVAAHVLKITSIDSFVSVVSSVLIDAGTLSGIDGTTLLTPFAYWSYCTAANRVSSSWILSVCANRTFY